MSNWLTLFSGAEEAANGLAQQLHAASIDVKTVAVPGEIVSGHGKRIPVTQVQVWEEDEGRARSVLETWELPQAANAAAHSASLGRVLLVSLILPAFWILLSLLEVPKVPEVEPYGLGALWFASLLLAGQMDRP